MQKEENIINTDPPTNPDDAPSVQVKPGWSTSQGHLTAFFVLASSLCAMYLGWNWVTPELLDNIYQLITVAIVILGLLGINVPLLTNYINSRGKIQSNAIWATTAMNVGGLGDLFKKKVWKDPSTYIEIGKVASQIIPGGQVVGNVLDKVSGNGDDRVLMYLQNFDQRLTLIEEKLNIK